MLSLKYDVKEYFFKRNKGIGILYQFLHQFFFLLMHIQKYDMTFTAFSQYHTVLPTLFSRILKKKAFIMVGGTDAHYFPEYNYGNFNKKLLAFATCISLRLCTKIFPKHSSLVKSQYTYDKIEIEKQGYAYLCQNESLTKKSIVIENGYDSSLWYKKFEKEKNIFTVGMNLETEREYIRKGIDLIVELAKQFVDYKFIIIGGDRLPINNFPQNIELIKFVKNSDLINYYSRALVYLQFSTAEGFPNALCEAMLCECVPIGSNVFGITDIIGSENLILKRKDTNEAIALFKNVINSDLNRLGIASRKRIEEKYSYVRRQKLLLDAIENEIY